MKIMVRASIPSSQFTKLMEVKESGGPTASQIVAEGIENLDSEFELDPSRTGEELVKTRIYLDKFVRRKLEKFSKRKNVSQGTVIRSLINKYIS